MPRLPTKLINKAHRISPLVALLLRACRDLPSAKNEMRWICEHVSQIRNNNHTSYTFAPPSAASLRYHEKLHLYKLCKSRSRGVPLQYILGTQPFGDLEIKCRRGGLIPRSETEAYTLELSRILLNEIHSRSTSSNTNGPLQDKRQDQTHPNRESPRMRILDICSGTGCISLQLYAQLRHACPDLEIIGLDVSQKAINLSNENIRHNNLKPQNYKLDGDGPRQCISYHRGDLFCPSGYINDILGLGVESPSTTAAAPERSINKGDSLQLQRPEESDNHLVKERGWDLIVSNPPYISPESFSKDTTRSVRNFEPKLALVPDDDLLSTSTSDPASASASTSLEPSNDMDTSLVSSCQPEDIFYARILDLFLPGQRQGTHRPAPPKRMLFEVADLEQASRVVEMMNSSSVSANINTTATIEIWRDDPSFLSSSSSYCLEEGGGDTSRNGPKGREEEEVTNEHTSSVVISGREIPIRGAGNVRSVYFFASAGTSTAAATGAGESLDGDIRMDM